MGVLNKGENKKGTVLAKQNEKEGFLNKDTGKFTVKQWTTAEREEYESTRTSSNQNNRNNQNNQNNHTHTTAPTRERGVVAVLTQRGPAAAVVGSFQSPVPQFVRRSLSIRAQAVVRRHQFAAQVYGHPRIRCVICVIAVAINADQ